MIIADERQRELKTEAEKSTLRHERHYGKFETTFTLPPTINTNKIEAQYENGVLSVVLPKTEATKGRTFQIQAGQGIFFGKRLVQKNRPEVRRARRGMTISKHFLRSKALRTWTKNDLEWIGVSKVGSVRTGILKNPRLSVKTPCSTPEKLIK